MKTVTVRDLQKKVRDCVEAAQEEGLDWETVLLQTSASFWKLIERRRKEPTSSLDEVRERLARSTRGRRSAAAARTARSRRISKS